jgi:hypothetical protein
MEHAGNSRRSSTDGLRGYLTLGWIHPPLNQYLNAIASE